MKQLIPKGYPQGEFPFMRKYPQMKNSVRVRFMSPRFQSPIDFVANFTFLQFDNGAIAEKFFTKLVAASRGEEYFVIASENEFQAEFFTKYLLNQKFGIAENMHLFHSRYVCAMCRMMFVQYQYF